MLAPVLGILGWLLMPEPVPAYPWPVKPFDGEHAINGTLGEFRNRDPLHCGVDIDALTGTEVYSIDTDPVDSISGAGSMNENVRIGRFRYLHVLHSKGLLAGQQVTALDAPIGTVNSANHLHLEESTIRGAVS